MTTPDIDDETVQYIVEHRKRFEDLRQVAAQLAGLLVLSASGARSTPDHPMLEAAGRMLDMAVDGLRSARPTPRAARHHRHLIHASIALEQALAAARGRFGRSDVAIDPVLVPLKVGYGHLQRAASLLPGFELVSFECGCCAVHGTGRAGGKGAAGVAGRA